MRILQIHNRYNIDGGEDVVVKSESYILRKKKNEVNLFEVSNENIIGTASKIRTALNVCYSQKYNKLLYETIKEFRPDLVHVHNFFPLLTPSIYDVCIRLRVPVVQTLHNYRIICPGAYLMRKGHVCEDCLTGTAYKAALYGCYRGSRIGSFAVANMVQFHRQRKTWQKKIDQFIALTKFSMNKFILAGIPSEKIQVKPNFMHTDPGMINCRGKYVLFVGRISSEKGIATLLQSWEKIRGISLKIIGEGKLFESLKKIKAYKNLPNIEILGKQHRKEVFQFMKNAMFILYPSEWYEMFGLVCVEAFACGKAVIASRLGSMAEIVEDGVTGLHFEPGNSDDLADKIQWLIDHPKECHRMGNNARQVYLEKYTAEKNYDTLINIYHKTISKYN